MPRRCGRAPWRRGAPRPYVVHIGLTPYRWGGFSRENWEFETHRMVGGEVLALQVGAALSPIVEPDEERPDVVRPAVSDHEAIAGQAAGLVDQGRGGRPAGLVERGGVHRGQDSIERVVFADDRVCPPSRWRVRKHPPSVALHIEGHWRTGGTPEGDAGPVGPRSAARSTARPAT